MTEEAGRLTIRVDLARGGRIGPGKIALLEAIGALGSITAAGRSMNMSYKKAWALVDEINGLLGTVAVAAQTGGQQGGGAALTPAGEALVARYRAIEQACAKASQTYVADIAAIGRMPPTNRSKKA